MPEDIIQEVEKAKKEVAASEGKAVDFGFYLLLDRIEGLRNDFQRQLTEVKEDLRREIKQEVNGLRQEMKQEISSLRQEISSVRQEMKQEVNSLRHGMKEEISGLRQEMNALRQELKEDVRHIDAKLNNVIWAAIGTFFAVLVGAAGIVVAIYYTVPK